MNVDLRRATLTVPEAAEIIGISRAQAYRCVKLGELRAVQLGRRIVVPRVAVEELLGMSIAAKPAHDESSVDTGLSWDEPTEPWARESRGTAT